MTTEQLISMKEADALYGMHTTYKSRESYFQAVKRRLKAHGLKPERAKYDSAGNCLACGEAGRCPGYHAKTS